MSIQKFLQDIHDTGLSDYKIADLIGTDQPQINRWRRSKHMPFYDTGVKIQNLAEKLCPDLYPK